MCMEDAALFAAFVPSRSLLIALAPVGITEAEAVVDSAPPFATELAFGGLNPIAALNTDPLAIVAIDPIELGFA